MKIVFILCAIIIPVVAQAQEYKEGLLYDVTGPVKVLSTHRSKPTASCSFGLLESASFRTDGKSEQSVTIFNQDGYPMGFTIDANTLKRDRNEMSLGNSPQFEAIFGDGECLNISYNVEYDDSHKISSSVLKYDIDFEFNGIRFKKSMTTSTDFQYSQNSKGMPEVCLSKSNYKLNGEDYESCCTYTGYVYDKHGNWITRNVLETFGPVGNESLKETIDYVETRVVSYYE